MLRLKYIPFIDLLSLLCDASLEMPFKGLGEEVSVVSDEDEVLRDSAAKVFA